VREEHSSTKKYPSFSIPIKRFVAFLVHFSFILLISRTKQILSFAGNLYILHVKQKESDPT